MLEEKDATQCFRKVLWFFTGKRFKDSSWSWIVCVSSAVCHSVNLGIALSFGVLFPVLMDFFDETRERTAFVGSIGLGMVWFASPLAGYLCDRFGCRISCFLGSMLCIVGLVSSSFVQSLTVMYFTYSALYGLGACLIFNPCILVLGKCFTDKLSIATGIVSLGGSVGILYTGPLLQALLDSFEWRNTLRIIAGMYFLVFILCLTFNSETAEKFKNNNEEEREDKTGISLYCSVWSFPAYTVLVTSLMFACFGMYIPSINLVKFCEDIGISAQKGSQLFIYIGLASSVSRLVSGRLCCNERVNPVYIYQSGIAAAGLATFMLHFTTEYWILIAFSVVYGLSDGVFATTQCYILLTIVDSKRTTAAFCIYNVLSSFPSAAGGPVAALIADQTGDYMYSFYMTGGVLLTASVIPVILIFVNRGTYNVQQQNWKKFSVQSQDLEVEKAKEEKIDTVTKELQTDQGQVLKVLAEQPSTVRYKEYKVQAR